MDQETLLSWVSGWPGVTHEVKWHDDLVFMVADKMFMVYCFQGKNHGQLGFKVEDERFLELTDRPHIHPAPYMARAHWISLMPLCEMGVDEKRALIRRAYELVRAKLTRKLQRELAD
jgi:predicted DNA-binding protein (MmcQ/YjbR family)